MRIPVEPVATGMDGRHDPRGPLFSKIASAQAEVFPVDVHRFYNERIRLEAALEKTTTYGAREREGDTEVGQCRVHDVRKMYRPPENSLAVA